MTVADVCPIQLLRTVHVHSLPRYRCKLTGTNLTRYRQLGVFSPSGSEPGLTKPVDNNAIVDQDTSMQE